MNSAIHLEENFPQFITNSKEVRIRVEVPSGSDLLSEQVQRKRCVHRSELQDLGFISSAL